jgi:death on curing protein
MTAEPQWISKKALLLLHEESLGEFGGARGLRDEGRLDSALDRAKNAWAYNKRTTLAQLATSYAFGLTKNHPFVDGNKRMAFMSIGLFLALNGYRLKADQVDAAQIMYAPASGNLDEPGLATWVKANMTK